MPDQNGQSISYKLDPANRVSEAIYSGTSKGTLINHYAGPGQSPAWSEEGGVVTREIAGISGGLRAIQTNGGTPVLQLSNLHGDTIATVGLAETEPKLLSTSDTTEFGVPRTSSPPRYNYLGADELPTELSSGIIGMGARTYVPELGRFEQTDPQPGGSGNPYTYTHNDPVNQADPSGEWTNTVSYDYEAAETGASHGLAETYTGPGAILPPPVNAQIEEEFVAHPPWDAATVFQGSAEGTANGYGLISDMMARDKSEGGPEWDEGHEAGSRCTQYGGHWTGKKCVGLPSSSNEGLRNACTVAGVLISLSAFPESVPATVAKVIAGGGAAATSACRAIGG